MVPGGLRGRERERRALEAVIDAARAGQSDVLVLRGRPGVGKTALLDHLRARADGCALLETAGIESEGTLAYAGLHRICSPVMDGAVRLPEPQRVALGTALGLHRGDAPDVFLVGLAVLGLLSEAAEGQPLIGIVDDAHWLDRESAQALAFVARRLLADGVGLVFAVREPTTTRELEGLPTLAVDGLRREDARALLDAAAPGLRDRQVRERILVETAGNPLALLELTRGRSPAEIAGGFAAPATGRLVSRIEESFTRRLSSLPPDGQRLVRLASVEPVGDPNLLWRAAARLEIDPGAAAAAEASGLLELDHGVRFAHPLARSAAYRSAGAAERRAAHQALSDATDHERDPDRRAWHQGQAVVEPDEQVARELQRSAATARSRGGVAAAAAFLERAAELTPDPKQRADRALAAAQTALEAAAPEKASELITTAEWSPLDELQQTKAMQLRGRIAFAERRGHDAPPLLFAAARRLERLDSPRAREAYLETLGAALFAGRLSTGPTAREVAEAAQRVAPSSESPPTVELLIDGLVVRFADGYEAAVDPLRRVLEAHRDDGHEGVPTGWLWLACRIASDLWEDGIMQDLADLQLRLARAAGALTVLPLALAYRAGVHLHRGELRDAAALSEESAALTASVGGAPARYSEVLLEVWRGDEDTARRALDAGVVELRQRGEGRSLAWAKYGSALLANSTGDYAGAIAPAQLASERDELGISGWAQLELIEATARSGRSELGIATLDRLAERTQASGTSWALGVEARSRALLSSGRRADDLYQEALGHLSKTQVAVHLARTHLVYGEWLRREGRRVDAREQLRTAHAMFSDFGTEAFATRARRELAATGETVRRRMASDPGALTPQEAQIARLAREGHTNPEIGGQLFISPRTVEYHLHKVFTKLGISSRRELRRAPLDATTTPTAQTSSRAAGST